MKKLPKIFQNDLSKIINNNKNVCYLKNEIEPKIEEQKINSPKDRKEIMNELDKIFNGIGNSYNIPLEIKTTNKMYNTSLISRTNNNVITIDNEVIPIIDIINISRVNNK